MSSTSKTPLRYPGGKQKLWPFIAEIVRVNDLVGGSYIEPYAGGAGVAMELLTRGIVSEIHLNDKCPLLFAFWKSVFENTKEFISKIKNCDLNIEEWEKMKKIIKFPSDYAILDIGFAFFYLNRTNFSGIINGGPIGGKNQNGSYKLDARFAKERLYNLVSELSKYRKKVFLYNMDAKVFLIKTNEICKKQHLIYCDPPYYNKGNRLYLNAYKHDEHLEISKILKSLKTKWIVSYDNAPEILSMYEKEKSFIFDLQYNAKNKYLGKEFFVFSKETICPSNYTTLLKNVIPNI